MKNSFRRHIATVGALTGISRILGFVRDMVTAWLLGAGPLADAFFVAFRIPNLLRRFMAEGAVSVAFVPVFNEAKESDGLEKALSMFRDIMTLMFYCLVGIVILGEIVAPLLVALIAPGFYHDPIFATTVHLTRIMFPFILLIGILALFMGVLNSLGHFALPAAAPIILNIFMIGVPVLGYIVVPFFKSPADALAWGVMLGGIAQILLQIPALRRNKVSLSLSRNFHNPRIRQVTRLMGVAAIGASQYQIGVFIGTLLASLLATGSVSYLYYANRLVELPLGIFAFAVGNVVLPAMSTASARMDYQRLSSLMRGSLTTVLLFTIPATIGLIILAEPIIAILFMRGKFTMGDVLNTALALQMYALALWAIGYTRIQNQTLYAMQQAKLVVNIGWLSQGLNILLSIVLMQFLRHAGIALASTIAVAFQLVCFHTVLKRRGIGLDRAFFQTCGKMLLAALAMSASLIPFVMNRFWTNGLNFHSLVMLTACMFLAIGIYFASLWLMGVRGIWRRN
jgi:putative peptidoglycan lipid II flippase